MDDIDVNTEISEAPSPSMVERVARAICEAHGCDPDDFVEGGQASGFANYGPLWQAAKASDGQCVFPDYVAFARVAIEAMREPTVAQLAAGQKAWLKDDLRRSSTLYRAMIDAAMEGAK